MITSIDIKLEPVPGGVSGEFFKLKLKTGTTFIIDIDNFTTITQPDGTIQFIPNDYNRLMTITESGVGIQEKVFIVPVQNIRYMLCYYI